MQHSACLPQHRGSVGGCAMGLLAVTIIAGLMLTWMYAVNYTYSHGPTKHGDAALEVRQCLDSNGPMSIWYNPVTGRHADICDLGNRWGVSIRIGDDELTAFVKEKMMKYDQVIKYLKNRGYECLTGQCL